MPVKTGIQNVLDSGLRRNDGNKTIIIPDENKMIVMPVKTGIQNVLDSGLRRNDTNNEVRHAGENRYPGNHDSLRFYTISSYRSRHSKFPFSISSNFHRRFHSLIVFSRAIADSIVSCSSNHTNR